MHIDETTVRMRKAQGYVWVLTTMDKVYYFYRPSRETGFLREMLASFRGVLVSDFYTGYDLLPCEQQKCLVHFIRDIDDDLLRNPLDSDLSSLAMPFGRLLRTIVATIDRCGLKTPAFEQAQEGGAAVFGGCRNGFIRFGIGKQIQEPLQKA